MVSRNSWKRTVRITAKVLLSFGTFCVVVAASYHPQSPLSDIKEAQAAADGTGLLVYDEDGANNVAPRYRTWSGSDLGAESSAQDDESASDDTNHTIVAASTTRNEYIMGRLEVNGHLDIQVFNATGSTWSDGTNAPTNGNFTTGIGTTNDIYRGFDIAYEEDSGDAIVVYESSSTGDGILKYRTWDGDSWSNEASIDYSGVDEGNDVARWVECEADHGTDYIMCGWREQTNLGVYAAVWTGSAWQHITQISAENGTSTRQDFDVAWEGTSGEGMIVYGDVTGAPFVDASTYTASGGFADTSGMKDPGAAVQWLTIASSPSNNYIAVMINDTSSTTSADMGVEMWNGSDWSTVSNPTDDSDINNNGYAQGQDVAWEQGGGDRALFVWRDGTVSETALRYMFYDISANQWQAIEDGTQCTNTEGGAGSVEVVTALANAEDAAGPCKATLALADSFSGVRLKPDPASNKIMVLAEDLTLDLAPEAFLYNGDTNATWTQTATMSSYEIDLSTGATLTTSLPTMPYDFAYRESSSTNISTFGSQTTSVNGGTTNFHVGGGFAINRTALSTNVTSITIAEQGTVDGQANLDNIKLYYDSDTTAPYNCASESYSGGESQFGSTDTDGFSSANGSSTFTGSVSISSTSTMCVYVVLDITSGATDGQTIEIQITNPNTDVAVSAGTVGPDHIRAISGTTTISVFSISGTCAKSDRSTACDGDDVNDSIKVAYNGVVQGQSDTTVDGSWQITGVATPAAGDVVTIYIDGAADSREAVAVTKYDGAGALSGVLLYWQHLTIGSGDNQSVTNANLSTGWVNDEDVFYSVSTNNLTLDATTNNSGQSLYVLASNTYAPGGTITLAGSWINAGTFTHGSSTVTLNGTTSGYIINANNSNGPFNNLTLNGSGGVWTVTSTHMNVAGALTVTAGEISLGSQTTTFTGTGTPISNSGTFTAGSSTVVFTGSASVVTIPALTYNNLELKAGGTQTHRFASGTVVVNGTFTCGNGTNVTTCDANTNDPTITVSGAFTVATLSVFSGSNTNAITLGSNLTLVDGAGSMLMNTGDVNFSATTTRTISANVGCGDNWRKITFTGSGGVWNQSGGTLCVKTMTINSGATLNMASSLYISSNGTALDGAGILSMSTSTVLTLNADGGIANTGDWIVYDLNTDGNNSLSGSGTLTITNTMNVATANVLNLGSKTLIFSKTGSGHITNAGTINYDTSTIRYTGAGSTTIATLAYYNLEIMPGANSATHTLSSGSLTVNNLTLGNGTNTSVIINGDIATDPTIDVNGNLTIAASTTFTAPGTTDITVGGNWSNSGTFTHSSRTVTFDAGSTGKTISANGSNGAFYNLTFNNAAGGWTVSTTDLTVANILTITAGNLSGGSRTTTLSAIGTPFVNNGTFTYATSTIRYTGNGATNITAANMSNASGGTNGYYNLEVYPAGATEHTLGTAASQTIGVANNLTIGNGTNAGATGATNNPAVTVGGVLTIATAATLTTGTGTYTLTGSGTPFVVNGTGVFTASTGNTVAYTGTGTTNVYGGVDDVTNAYYNLSLLPAATVTYRAGSAGPQTQYVSASNNLTIGNGTNALTLDIGNFNPVGLAAYGTMTLAASAVLSGSGDTFIDGLNVVINGTVNTTGTARLRADGANSTFQLNTSGNSVARLRFGDTVGVQTTTASGGGSITVTNEFSVATSHTLNAGNLTITLTGTSGTPFVNDGTFNPDTSTIVYAGNNGAGNTTITNTTYNNLTLNASETFTMGTNQTVNGTLTITTGTLTAPSGTLTIGDDFSNSGTFSHNSGTVLFTGAVVHDIGGSSSTAFNNFTNTTAGSTLRFKHHTANVPLYDVAGTFTVTGANGNNITITSDDGANQWLVDFASAQSSVTYATISYSGCLTSANVTLDATSTDSSPGGTNGTCWVFPSSGVIVTGTLYSDEGSTAITSGPTVRAKVNGAGSYAAAANGSGVYSIGSVSVNAGDVVTIYIDGATENAVAVTRAADSSTTISVNLYQDRVILRHEDGGPLTNANLDNYDYVNESSDGDIGFTVTGSALTVHDGWKTIVWTGKTFTPGGTVTTDPSASAAGVDGDLTIQSGATLSMASNALSIGGDFTNSGTFSKNSIQNTTFTATATGHAIEDGTSNFAAVTFNGSGGGWSFSSDVTLSGNLTVTVGTLSGTNNITVSGGNDVGGAGTVTLTGGTFIHDGAGYSDVYLGPDGANNWTFNNLTLQASVLDANHWGGLGAGTIAVSGTLTIGNISGTNSNVQSDHDITSVGSMVITSKGYFAAASTLSVSGNWTDTGFFSPGSGTVTFTATSTGKTITTTGSSFYNLTFNGSGGGWTLQDATTVSNVLTITAGDFSAGSTTLTLSGTGTPFVKTGTFTPSASTFRYTGNGATNITSTTYYNLEVKPAGATAHTFGTGASQTLTANNVTIGDGTNAGATADTNDVTLDVNGNFTIAAGATFTASNAVDMTVAGSWANSGTFNNNGRVVNFDGTGTGKTIVAGGNSNPFHDLTISGSGTWTVSTNALKVNRFLTVNSGTLQGDQDVTVLGGDVSGTGTINMTGGTFLTDGDTVSGWGSDTAWTFYNLTFGDGTGIATTTISSSSNTQITVTNTLTIAANQSLDDAPGKNWIFSGSGTPIVNTGQVSFDSVGVVTFTSGSGVTALATNAMTSFSAFPNLVINGAGTFTAGVAVAVKDSLTVSGGTLAMGANALTVGNVSNTNSGNIKVASGQSITQSSGATTTILSSASGANCIGSSGTACSGTAGTITFGNLTIGDASTSLTTSIGGTSPTVTVGGLLTVSTNATLSAGSSTIALTGNSVVFTNNGAFTSGTGTVAFNSSATTGTTVPALTYYNLTLNRASNVFTGTNNTVVQNNFTLTAGTFTAPSGSFTVGGDFTNNGTFTHSSGTVIFNTSSTIATLGGVSTSFYNVTVTTPGKTVRFTNGNTYTFNGTLTVTGSAGSPINLLSNSNGTQWTFYLAGTASISYLNVKDSACHASSVSVASSDTINNGGNNGSCWGFIARGGGGGATADGGSGSSGNDNQSGGGAGATCGTASGTVTISGGAVTAVVVVNGGGCYTAVPVATICGGGGSGATITAVLTNGVVTSVTVNAGGSGYGSPTVVFGNSPDGLGGGCPQSGGGGGGGGGGSP